VSGWAQRSAEALERGECNCDQSLALAKRLDVALEALDAIKAVCEDPTTDWEATGSWVRSIVALAGANLERVK
jgi:hypothetical protein